MSNSFKTGFVKRAAEYGLNQQEAEQLFKQADFADIMGGATDWMSAHPQATGAIAGGALGAGAGLLAGGPHRMRNALLGGAGGAGLGYVGGKGFGGSAGDYQFNGVPTEGLNQPMQNTNPNPLSSMSIGEPTAAFNSTPDWNGPHTQSLLQQLMAAAPTGNVHNAMPMNNLANR